MSLAPKFGGGKRCVCGASHPSECQPICSRLPVSVRFAIEPTGTEARITELKAANAQLKHLLAQAAIADVGKLAEAMDAGKDERIAELADQNAGIEAAVKQAGETIKHGDRLLHDALTTLRYIAYGDLMEGVRPSDPAMEADLAVKRIMRGKPEGTTHELSGTATLRPELADWEDEGGA